LFGLTILWNGFGLFSRHLAVLVLIGIPIAGTMWALLAVVVCGRVISGQLQLVFSAGWSVAWSVSVFASAAQTMVMLMATRAALGSTHAVRMVSPEGRLYRLRKRRPRVGRQAASHPRLCCPTSACHRFLWTTVCSTGGDQLVHCGAGDLFWPAGQRVSFAEPSVSGVFGPSGSNITPRSIGGLGGLALWQLLPRLVAFTFALTLAYRLRPRLNPTQTDVRHLVAAILLASVTVSVTAIVQFAAFFARGDGLRWVAVAIPTALAVPAFIYLMARPNSEEATG